MKQKKNISIRIFDWAEKLYTGSILNRFRCMKVAFDGLHRCSAQKSILQHYHRVNIDCKLDILHKKFASFIFVYSAFDDHGTQTFWSANKKPCSFTFVLNAYSVWFQLTSNANCNWHTKRRTKKKTEKKDYTKERMHFTRTHISYLWWSCAWNNKTNRKPSRFFRCEMWIHTATTSWITSDTRRFPAFKQSKKISTE